MKDDNILEIQVQQLQQEYLKLQHIIDSCKQSADAVNASLIRSSNLSMQNFAKSNMRSFMNSMLGNSRHENIGSYFGKFLSSMLSMRAVGGNVSRGVPYVVGERGPEVFTPQSSGYISPKARAQRNPINIVMNINTEDVDSFKRSKSQILAQMALALQSGVRGL